MTRKITLALFIFSLIIVVLTFGPETETAAGGSTVLRPDVATAIDRRFPASKRRRSAMRQYAFHLQQAVEHPEDALAINEKLDEASLCLRAVIQAEHETPSLIRFISTMEGVVANTVPRSIAYMKYNSNLNGHVHTTRNSDLKYCDTDSPQ